MSKPMSQLSRLDHRHGPVAPRPDWGPYRDTTYHGRPPLKPSSFDWKVSGYIFAGALGGSAQILATLADLRGDRRLDGLVRTGRYLAMGAAIVGPLLLIADLKTPTRWYNMLRIFRTTSPMSIGSYILTAFGGFSALAALGQFVADQGGRRRELALRFARLAGAPAAVAGAGMSVYTASLLAATSTPLWSAAPRLLALRFGSSAMAAAAAALSLAEDAMGRRDMAARLDRIALAAGAIHAVAAKVCDRAFEEHGVGGVLEERPWREMHRTAELATALPPLVHALNAVAGRRMPAVIANLAALMGSALERHLILDAGNHSAGRPEDYFRFTQPPRQDTPGRPAGDDRGWVPGPTGGERPIRAAAITTAEMRRDTVSIGPERPS